MFSSFFERRCKRERLYLQAALLRVDVLELVGHGEQAVCTSCHSPSGLRSRAGQLPQSCDEAERELHDVQ